MCTTALFSSFEVKFLDSTRLYEQLQVSSVFLSVMPQTTSFAVKVWKHGRGRSKCSSRPHSRPAQVLDAYDKRFPKTDHFTILSDNCSCRDTRVSGEISTKRNRSFSACN